MTDDNKTLTINKSDLDAVGYYVGAANVDNWAYSYLIFERISAIPDLAFETKPGSVPGLSMTN